MSKRKNWQVWDVDQVEQLAALLDGNCIECDEELTESDQMGNGWCVRCLMSAPNPYHEYNKGDE